MTGNTTAEKFLEALEKLAQARDELLLLTGMPDAQQIARDVSVLIRHGQRVHEGL